MLSRRAAVVAAAGVMTLGSIAAPHAAGADAIVTRVWRLERVVRDVPTIITFRTHVEEDERGLWGAILPLRLDRRGAVVSTQGGYITEDDPAVEPIAYSGPTVVGCRRGATPGGSCTLTKTIGASEVAAVVQTDASDTVNAILVVVSGIEPTLTVVPGRKHTYGWRARPVPLAARRALSVGTPGGNVGVATTSTTVESFTAASVRGGRRGSVAIATAPCRHAHRVGVVREGVGEATLSGGVRSAGFRCATDLYDATSFARGSTTWRFTGNVVGVGYGPTRIVVIDL